jgi:heme iron utilization protein
MNLSTEARQFLHRSRKGVLSTHSARFPGYPFGSIAPFVVDHSGCPVILISTLAEHTKNILQNPHVSLIVLDDADDMQANARLTVLGQAVAADKSDADLRSRYLRYFPQAAGYFDMHDFSFYRIVPVQARYIAGFGKMGWEEGAALTTAMPPLAQQETGIIEHMNADHADNLRAYCKHYHQMDAEQAEMIGIDSQGFDVRASSAQQPSTVLRFEFEQPIADAIEARQALVMMAKACRP